MLYSTTGESVFLLPKDLLLKTVFLIVFQLFHNCILVQVYTSALARWIRTLS